MPLLFLSFEAWVRSGSRHEVKGMSDTRVGGMESEVMETRSGGGCLVLFGLPFFLAGLAVMISWTGIIPAENDPPPWYIAVPFGLVFVCVGAAFLFGRGGVKLDRANRTVTSWWGLLVPFKSTTRSLDKYDHVTLSKEIRRSKNSTYTVYPVRLVGEEKDVKFEEPQDYGKARKKAEEVAGFLGFRIKDSTGAAVVWRSPEEFDESLRERARRTEMEVDVPDPPQFMQTRTRVEGRRVIIDLPSAGFKLQHVVGVVMGVAVMAGAVLFFALGPFKDAFKEPPPMNYFFMGFFSLFLLAPLIGSVSVLAGAFKRDRIIASPDGLRYEKKGVLFTRSTFIPADELEELVLPDMSARDRAAAQIENLEAPAIVKSLARSLAAKAGRRVGIQARSDRATIEFGRELTDEELRWLHAVIMKMMTV